MSAALQLLQAIDAGLGTRLAPDWLLLAAQFAVLVAVAVIELARSRNRNLVAILVAGTLIVLVLGQDWWVLAQLQTSSYVQQLFHLITLDGARLANLYLALATAAFTVAYVLNRNGATVTSSVVAGESQASRPIPYILATLWTLGASALVLVTSGGLAHAVSHPGELVAGQAGALMALTLGKLPLLDAVASRRQLRLPEAALFLLVLSLTVLNSRFLAVFLLVQLAVVWNYRRKELSPARLLPLAAGVVLILIVFGVYRDMVSYFPAGTPLDALTIETFLTQRAATGLTGWFYAWNVEGFTGLAGILTFTLHNGSLAHDFGLSILSFPLHLIPNGLRVAPSLPFMDISRALQQAYPYRQSIVAPGFELAYGGFGLPGVLALGGLLGWLCRHGHRAAQSARGDPLLACLLSVQLLQMVRGTFVTVLVFGIAEIVTLRLYRAMAAVEGSRAARATAPLAEVR